MGQSFQLSPGVVVREWDLTQIIPAIATSGAGIVGQFAWGPLEKVSLVSSEESLVSQYGIPDDINFGYWFSAKNFLDYSRNLKVIRVVGAGAANSHDDTGTPVSTVLIKNINDWQDNYLTFDFGQFAGRFPGIVADGIEIHMADDATFSTVQSVTIDDVGTGYLTLDDDSAVVVFSDPYDGGTTATGTLDVVGDVITGITITDAGSGYRNPPSVTIPAPVGGGDTATASAGLWVYYDQFLTTPGTTEYVSRKNGTDDGLHIVVVDGSGAMTGDKGRILERYAFCSKAKDATYDDGTSSYYPYVLRDRSSYIWFGDYPTSMGVGVGAWGNPAQDVDFNQLTAPVAVTLANGSGGATVTNAELIEGWNEFKNVDEIDVGLLISGPADRVLQDHIIQNVAEFRKDCVALISPEAPSSGGVGTGVINNKNKEVESLMKQRNVLPSSSYGVFDCNWKYQFDTYNDTFRWVPLNGDTAGLCARTDETRDPWWSPAGFNRGSIKNAVKLAWNPNKTDRDELYPNSINPIVTMAGEGTLLYGDRTMLTQPSAFDRINVRRLFIVLEKAIAKAAKYQLFEFNDEFTRLRFVQMVEPYLRDVQGRRGIYDFTVVCDETNNTPTVIDNNGFVGDIYIKPTRSINFITLNFVATGTGVVFDEIIGQFG